MKRFASDVMLTFSSRVISAGFLFLFRIALAFHLGPQDQGEYYWALQMALFLSIVAGMGMGQAGIYFLQKKDRNPSDILSSTFWLSLLSAAFFAFAFVAIMLVGQLSRSPMLIAYTAFAAVLQTMFQNGLRLLLGFGRNRTYNVMNIVAVVINVVCFYVLFGLGYNRLNAALISLNAATALTTALLYLSLFRSFPLGAVLFGTIFTERLRYGMASWLSAVIAFVNFRIDFYMVSSMLGSGESGFYSVSIMLAEAVWFVPDAVSLMLFPKVASQGKEDAVRFGSRIVRHTALLSMLATVAGGLAFSVVLRSVGSAYGSALAPYLLLLPGVYVFSICKVIAAYLSARRFLAISNYSTAIILVTNITGNLVLIPRLGLDGAALASSIGYAVGTAIAFWYFCRVTGLKSSSILSITEDDLQVYKEMFKKVQFWGRNPKIPQNELSS